MSTAKFDLQKSDHTGMNTFCYPQRVFSFFGAQRRKKNFFRPIFPSTSVGMEDVEWEVVEASGDAEATDVHWVVDCVRARRPASEMQSSEMWNKTATIRML